MVDRTTDDNTDYDLTSDLVTANGGDADPSLSGGEPDAEDTDDTVHAYKTAKEEPENKELSLRDQLSSAFKPEEKTDDKADDKAAKPEGDKPQFTQDAEGRWRKLDGTFASAEEVEQNNLSTQPAEEGTNVESIIATLPANVAEQIKSLPAETQQFVARTMEDLNGRATRYSEYEQLESVIGPRRQAWAQEGMNPIVAINQLFALSDFAGTNPEQFVLWFADQNGIDLDAALDARDNANANVSPEVQELRSQMQQLQQQLQGQPQQRQPDANVEAVQTFVNEKDEQGNLKRPYLSEVMPTFATQVSAVRAANPNMPNEQVLAKAYENACWADPNVRLKLQAEMDQSRREAARQKLEAKRAASSGVRGGPSGGTGASPRHSSGNLSLREELQQQFRAFGN